MIPELFAAHRWLVVPLLVLIACCLGAIWALVDGFYTYASARFVRKPSPVVPITSHTLRPFHWPAVKGFARLAQRPCEGTDDDCTGWATTTRDTSEGHCAREHFCAPCAAAYDHWLANYDGPPDGEAWSGGFTENH